MEDNPTFITKENKTGNAKFTIYDTQVALCMSLVVMVRNRKHFYELIDWFLTTGIYATGGRYLCMSSYM